uniref:Uncharacterized protein n=1 Tax=Bionectria ochroleuca TaxID=29856 RepID=A0A0B7JMI8_BIOOC
MSDVWVEVQLLELFQSPNMGMRSNASAGFQASSQERRGSSDLANLEATAKKSPDGKFYIVNGHKVAQINLTLHTGAFKKAKI